MGGSQSEEVKTTILNDTRVKNALRVTNKNISETTMKIVQESVNNTAQSADLTQEISIKGLKAKGDISFEEISQAGDMAISLSSFSNSELKQDLVTETRNQMQTALKEQMNMSQEQAKEDAEQMVSELLSAISETMQSLGAAVTGTDTSSSTETSITNLLNIETETELENLVESAISEELVNTTINNISSKLAASQNVDIADWESTDGGIKVGKISQEFSGDLMLEAISETGTGSSIIATVANVNVADIEKIVETDQSAKDLEEGTIGAAGDFVEKAVGAWAGLLQSGALFILIPVLIVGGLVLFMFRGTISKVAEQQAGVPQQPMPQQQFYQGGGGKTIKKGINFLKSILKNITKTIKKYTTKKNLILLVIIILASLIIYKVYEIIQQKLLSENFTEESKMDDVIITNKGKYLSNKKAGSGTLCLKKDKGKAFKFNIAKNDDNTVTIQKIGKGEKLYLKLNGNIVKLSKFNPQQTKKYNFSFEKKGKEENSFILFQGKKFLSFQKACLSILTKKEDASILKFE